MEKTVWKYGNCCRRILSVYFFYVDDEIVLPEDSYDLQIYSKKILKILWTCHLTRNLTKSEDMYVDKNDVEDIYHGSSQYTRSRKIQNLRVMFNLDEDNRKKLNIYLIKEEK